MTELLIGIQTALTFDALLFCLIGVTVGTLVGMLPGIGSLTTISLLLPLTYHADPTLAIIMFAGIYYGANYGGSISSITTNVPGTPSTAVSCVDGYPMFRKGRGGPALFLTAIASFVGGMVGLAVVAFLSPMVAQAALFFSPADYFAIMLLSLTVAATTAAESLIRNFIAISLGLALGLIGIDINTALPRYDFGLNALSDGINIAVITVGMFGLAEVINNITNRRNHINSIHYNTMKPSSEEWKLFRWPALRGAGIGSIFGSLPGIGPATSALVAYSVEKKISKNPEKFGKGAVEGLVAPESSNNAAVQSAFVPTLTLGIPGDAVMILILAALMLHGIVPSVTIMETQPELFWGVVASFLIGNVMLLFLNINLISVWIRILSMPYELLYPIIVTVIGIGVYSINNSIADIIMVAAFGVVGYLLKLMRFELTLILLGFVLGPLIEDNLRKTLIIARGDVSAFFAHPISAVLLCVTILLIVKNLFTHQKKDN